MADKPLARMIISLPEHPPLPLGHIRHPATRTAASAYVSSVIHHINAAPGGKRFFRISTSGFHNQRFFNLTSVFKTSQTTGKCFNKNFVSTDSLCYKQVLNNCNASLRNPHQFTTPISKSAWLKSRNIGLCLPPSYTPPADSPLYSSVFSSAFWTGPFQFMSPPRRKYTFRYPSFRNSRTAIALREPLRQ
jgi:hypothetical protein